MPYVNRGILRMLGVVAAASVVAFGLSQSASGQVTTHKSASAVRGGVFRYVTNDPTNNLDPLRLTSNGDLKVSVQIYEGLVKPEKGAPNGIAPAVATSWRKSKNGLTWTFHLRKNARFSNGQYVTAKDVQFSLERGISTKINPGFRSSFWGMKRVQVVNAHTIKIHLSHPVGALLPNLSIEFPFIYPANLVKKEGKAFWQHPVGSGPFEVANWVPGQYVLLKRNPYYWNKKLPYVNSVRITHVADDNARMLKLQSGGADVADAVPYSQIQSLSGQSGFKVQVRPIEQWDGIFFNLRKAPYSELNVRKALNYATDKATINKLVYGGVGQVANSMVPKGTYWAPPSKVPAYSYNIQRAKQLLAHSSVPNGFSATLIYPAGSSVHKELATILQSEWAQIGVKLTVQAVEANALFTQYQAGKFDMAIPFEKITSDMPAPDEFGILYWDPIHNAQAGFFDGWGVLRKHSPTFLKQSNNLWSVVRRAAESNSNKVRAKLWPEAQKMAMNLAPFIPLAFLPDVSAVANRVHGFDILPNAWANYDQVWLGK